MFGQRSTELLKELKRSKDGTLPPYNEDGVRQVLEEMKGLFDENQKEVRLTARGSTSGEQGLLSGIQFRHTCLERNQRCLLAYIHNRMTRIRDYRWQLGGVLPEEMKLNLCEQEIVWFNNYSKSLAVYMRECGLDLTEYTQPPKSLYIEVRCLKDYGEFVTEDGATLQLTKSSQHHLLRSQCEHLIRQGVLEHIQ